MKVKEESKNAGLKPNIQKTKIMASGPITSWQIDGKMETVTDFILGGSKITADGDCSHEIKDACSILRPGKGNISPKALNYYFWYLVVSIMKGSATWKNKKLSIFHFDH